MVEVPEPIDLSKIRPQQSYKKRAVPYGELGRTVLDVLSKAKGEPLHTTVISRQVLAKHGLPADRAGQKRARRSVISTLNELKAQRRVVRLASSSPIEQARWRRA
jgi:hypothetical protein